MKKNSRKCIRQQTLSFFVASAVGCSQVLSLIPVNTIAAEGDPAAQVSADVLYGDANNDGKVDNTDAALIEKYVQYDNMYTVDSAAADVDLDGTVTLSDAELVYQLNNAQISALPYTGDITWSTYPDPANYEIINTGITWQEAENYCEDNGGHLAVITTEKEQIMIESIIKSQESRKNNYWIGLMRYNENDFDWITAESMNYTNWHPGNPGNYGVDQNAVLFYGNDFAFGEWDDISDSGNCEGSSYYGLHNFGFILEKDGTPVSDYHLWKDSTCLPTSGKYKLDCDVTASRISVKESLDLDLNGHTVSIERVNCDGDVTITDTSEEQGGAMIASSSGTLLDIDGSLTLSGGTFIGNKRGTDVATIGINDSGCFTLDGAKVVSSYSNALSLRSSSGTTDIISGELFTEAGIDPNVDTKSTIFMADSYTGTLDISGGNIVSEYTSGIYCESNNGTVNISGGKIEGKARYGFYAPNGTALNLSGNCNIKGGIAGIYVPEDKKINITGNIVSFDTSVTSPVSGVITSGWAEFADAQFIPEGINGSVIVDADGELYFRSEEDDPDIPPVTTTPTTTSSTTTTTTTTTTTRAPFSPVTTEYNPRIEETIDEEKNERLQITGELTAKQMTPDEIESAGFDVEVPDNYHYFNYSVEFTFHDEPIIFTKYEAVPISPGDHVMPPVPKIVYPNSEPVGPGESVYIPEIKATATYFEYEEQEMFLIIYGESKWLKEFFDVQLIVMNTDNETLEDCSATLDVPEGLTLCNSDQTQFIGDLLPNDVKSIHWYLRGDIAGEYNISVLSEGKNDGEIFSYPFYSENDIRVYAGDALKMTIETHGYSCFGSEYPICISMQNVSDKPIYHLQNKIKNVEHGYYNYKHFYNGGIRSDIETKVPLGGSVTKTIDVDELLPGESAVIEISITDMWKSPLQKELDNSKLYVDAFSLLLGKSPISAFIANYTSQFIEGITVDHVLDSYVVTTLKNSTTKVPYEIVINDNLNEIGEDRTFGFVDAIECSIMDQASDGAKRIFNDGKCFESGFEFRSDFKENILEDWQKVENGEMSRESFDKKYDKEYNDYIFGNTGNEATVSGFDMAEHLEVGKDIYKIVSIPPDATTATAYVTDADGNIIDKGNSRQDVMGKMHTAAFEFEILNGGFEYNDGVYTFYEDSLIRLRANSANKTYYVHFVTDDGREEVFPFITVPEHECEAGKYYVVSGTGSGTEGLAMQFCEVCNKPLKTRRIPASFNAMLSDGQMFQNIYQAAEFAGENYDEIELSIFGDITLDKDLVIPENVKLIITPFANITLKNSAHIVVDGEYKDFSTDKDTEIYENIVLNYWDGRTETMPVKYGTEVTELPVLSETCGFTGWYTDAEFTEPFVPFTSGDKNHSKVYYADVHHSFDTSGKCSICGEIKNGMDAFQKIGISVSHELTLKYIVELTDKALADKNFRIEFDLPNGKTQIQNITDAVDNGNGTYTFRCSIPIKYIDDNIKAQVYYSNNVKGSYLEYSVKKYSDYIIANSDIFGEVTVNSIKAMLNFSGYVQIFAGKAPAEAANADLGMPLDDVDPEIGDEFNAVKTINSDSISISAANLSMDKLTNINIKFNISAGANVNDYIFTVDGNTVTPKKSGSTYCVTMEGISPVNFDKMYEFKVQSKNDDSDFVSLKYSCITYAKKVLEISSDKDLRNTMKALYFFNQEIKRYVSQEEEE